MRAAVERLLARWRVVLYGDWPAYEAMCALWADDEARAAIMEIEPQIRKRPGPEGAKLLFTRLNLKECPHLGRWSPKYRRGYTPPPVPEPEPEPEPVPEPEPAPPPEPEPEPEEAALRDLVARWRALVPPRSTARQVLDVLWADSVGRRAIWELCPVLGDSRPSPISFGRALMRYRGRVLTTKRKGNTLLYSLAMELKQP